MDDLADLADEANRTVRALLDGDARAARPRLAALRGRLVAALARAHDDAAVAAAIGEALALAGDGEAPEGAEAALGRALAVTERRGAPAARARVLAARARLRYLHGRFAEASADAEAALALVDEPVGRRDAALALRVALVASVTDRDTGRLERARARAADVRRRAAALGDAHVVAWAELHEASAALMSGEVGAARAGYERATCAARALGMQRVEALATTNLGHCAERAAAPEEACARFVEGRAMFAALGDGLLQVKLDVRLARATLEGGRADEAERLAQEAAARARAVDDRDTAVRAALVLGRVRLAEALAVADRNGFVSIRDHALAPPLPARALRVARDAAWFEAPSGDRIDLRTRVALRRLFAHLVERRLQSGRGAATTDDLVRAGWPDERIMFEAARDRVYTAIGTLRRLGLGPLLVRTDGGYALDPAVEVQVAS